VDVIDQEAPQKTARQIYEMFTILYAYT